MEFQFRGSPYIHSFLWVPNSPLLAKENKEQHAHFIEQVIRADLPDPNTKSELYALVKKYQAHGHSNSCKKYKNVPCRFQFGRLFTERTIIASPLPEDLPDSAG